MALDAENLRRSKRNKFHLDVAAIHMVHPERRRTQPGRLTPSSDGAGSRRAASLSPAHQGSPVHSEADEEERGKRVRRVPVRNASYVYDDDSDEDEDCKRGLEGSNMCIRCPARFETRPGLANHFKLHGGEKRKFACEICDFSAITFKSLRIHKRVHDRYGVGPAVDMKPNETRSSDSASPDIGGSPPQLSPAVSTHATSLIRSHTEPGRLVALSLSKTTLKRTTVVATQLSTSPSKNPSSPSNIATQRSPGRRRRKCPQCPFTARTTTRMERHMIGHSKETGFQCSLCNFKTESAGFLKRHVEVHGVTSFSWPPQYVGISPRPRKPASIARTKGEVRNGRITASPAKVLPLFSLREGTGGLRCPIDGCTFATRLLPQMVCHKMKCHPDARDKRRSLFPCKKCGARLRTAGALRVHRLARHVRVRHPKTIQFFMRERVGMHFVSSRAINHTRLRTERSSTNNEFKTGKEAKEEAIDMDESSSSLPITCQLDSSIDEDEIKIYEFKCTLCPYSAPTRSRLDRHEAKHVVKSDNQCPHCTFSCRNREFFEQHVRLHQSRKSAIASVSDPSMPVISTSNALLPESSVPRTNKSTKIKSGRKKVPNPRLLRFIGPDGVKRRRCAECPYVSKFSCDMRSHQEMHNMRGRFRCSQCSYSTKRAISLRTHLALHAEENDKRANTKPVTVTVHKVDIGTKRGCGEARVYTCKHCSFVAKICAELWKHARRHLTSSRSLRCSVCTFSSLNMDLMEDHQLLHPEGTAFIRQVQDEVDNMQHVPPVDYRCKICPFQTSVYQRMWNHTQKHKRASKYTCAKCSFSTGSEQCLEDHMVVHSEPGSGVVTSAPSPIPETAPSTDPKPSTASVSTASNSPISQKSAPVVLKSERTSVDDSSIDSVPSLRICARRGSDVIRPLSIDVAAAVERMRPTKEVFHLLRKEKQAEEQRQCPDCPFSDPDETVFRLHREMHGGRQRAYACNLCSYSCFAAEALHWHLSFHLPPLSPTSAATQRRKALGRRRFQSSEAIPLGAKHFACSQCPFRTLSETTFLRHRQGHAQHIQQRLVTQMKRAAIQEEEGKRANKTRRPNKKSDKNHTCSRCSFRCETAVAYSRHWEMHSQCATFQCRICDYSATTKNIVDFHEQNHHLDQSITHLRKSAILAPDLVKLPVVTTPSERARLAGQEFRCKRCPFHSLELSALARHWEELHCETEEDKETALFLSVDMVPANSILTIA